MPRMARIVVPGLPHHITQRGIRGYRTFFNSLDYLTYIELLKKYRRSSGVSVWAYCLMPNHIHVVAVPEAKDSLAKLFRQVHSRYALQTNGTHGWKGHLWQERYFSSVMDETHTLAALRYVEFNPVRAGLCRRPQDWRWSSIHAHIGTRRDEIVDTKALREIVPDWRSFVDVDCPAALQDSLRKSTRSGRPAGDDDFVDKLEHKTGKTIPGRRRRCKSNR